MKSPYHYVCLDCRSVPPVSEDGRISIRVIADSYKKAGAHVKQYNHRVAAINKNRRIVFVYFLEEENQFKRKALKEAPPF